MKTNWRATERVATDTRDEFVGIRKDILPHLAPDISVDHARALLAQHVPTLVLGRGQLLLDSLLNYLMQDARAALADAPTDVKNQFYDQDLRNRMRETFRLEPHTLEFSFDPRFVTGGAAAGGTLVLGGLVAGLVISAVVPRIIVGLATLVGAAFAFRAGHSAGTDWARRALESDVAGYIDQSERCVATWLDGVRDAFFQAFDAFAAEHGMAPRENA